LVGNAPAYTVVYWSDLVGANVCYVPRVGLAADLARPLPTVEVAEDVIEALAKHGIDYLVGAMSRVAQSEIPPDAPYLIQRRLPLATFETRVRSQRTGYPLSVFFFVELDGMTRRITSCRVVPVMPPSGGLPLLRGGGGGGGCGGGMYAANDFEAPVCVPRPAAKAPASLASARAAATIRLLRRLWAQGHAAGEDSADDGLANVRGRASGPTSPAQRQATPLPIARAVTVAKPTTVVKHDTAAAFMLAVKAHLEAHLLRDGAALAARRWMAAGPPHHDHDVVVRYRLPHAQAYRRLVAPKVGEEPFEPGRRHVSAVLDRVFVVPDVRGVGLGAHLAKTIIAAHHGSALSEAVVPLGPLSSWLGSESDSRDRLGLTGGRATGGRVIFVLDGVDAELRMTTCDDSVQPTPATKNSGSRYRLWFDAITKFFASEEWADGHGVAGDFGDLPKTWDVVTSRQDGLLALWQLVRSHQHRRREDLDPSWIEDASHLLVPEICKLAIRGGKFGDLGGVFADMAAYTGQGEFDGPGSISTPGQHLLPAEAPFPRSALDWTANRTPPWPPPPSA